MNSRQKILCILHRSPPYHGAAKVGDFVSSSQKLQDKYECKFITIKSSYAIGDIGTVNLRKVYLVAELCVKLLVALFIFRPQKVYFTASVRGAALYRDLLVSTLWKVYGLFKPLEVYYHYHTKGVDEFVSASDRNLKLTRFFLKDVNLLLLSSLLKKDFDKVRTYKQIKFLPNGVEDPMLDVNVGEYLKEKYDNISTVEALYLAHMMKEKGYWEVLELARDTKGQNIRYHFAGSWKDEMSKNEFFAFVEEYGLENQVVYHGFVSGKQKSQLFKKAHLLLYPSKNDAFPLTLLESLSYCVSVIATNEGSIPYILDEQSGIILNDVNKLKEALEQARKQLLNKETAMYCRQRYLDNFSLEQFEDNLVNNLKA